MKKVMLIGVLIFLVSTIWATTIYDIQYTTDPGPDGTYPSPLVDEEVTVTGIVTGANYNQDNKFFMSDPGGGEWHGIYVYDFETGPALGDEVEVTGTVTEYYGLTELGYCSINILSSGNPVPAPLQVSTLNLAIPAQAEQYEGCLVQVNDVEVTEAQDDYGQWYITDGSGDCQVDDGFFYLDSVTPPIVIEVGMQWAIIRGCVDYSYDEYAINPRTPDDLIDEVFVVDNTVNPRSEIISAYPNPFNPETTVQYQLKEADKVTLAVYNIKGEKVKTLVNNVQSAGTHEVVWFGNDDDNRTVSSGVYFFKLEAAKNSADYTSTKKVIFLK